MNYFDWKNENLFCEGVSVEDLARQYKTPLYIYSYTHLHDQFVKFDKAFTAADHLICYSMKANPSHSILKTFVNLGGGIDVVTGGELFRALHAGCPANKIVFSGVGKSEEEITQALKAGILQFNVESIAELEAINRVALSLNKKAPIAIRVNPDVDPKTHPYISTGMKKSKFGISHDKTVALYKKIAAEMKGLEIVGIDCHIGSQLTLVSPFVDAVKKVRELILEIQKAGIPLKQVDMGGGLGIVYKDETPPDVGDYAKAILDNLSDLGLKLIFEPGRFLVGNAGLLVTKVLYNKQRDAKKFVIVDAASNDLIRPALYGSYHRLDAVKKVVGRKTETVDIVGPICETGDFFAQDRELPEFNEGELIGIFSAGAYGLSMSSNYNSRPRACEVMVKGDKAEVIRERENFEELVSKEKKASFIS